MSSLYFRTSYHLDILHNLEFLDEQLKNFIYKEYQYKWLIIGMHSLLQSVFVICVKERGSNFQISKRQDVKKWFENYDNDEDLFLMNLAHFQELGRNSIQTILQPGTEEYKNQLKMIEYFNNNRNRLIHFNIDSMAFSIYDILYFTTEASKLIQSLFEKNKYKINIYEDNYSKYINILESIMTNSNRILKGF